MRSCDRARRRSSSKRQAAPRDRSARRAHGLLDSRARAPRRAPARRSAKYLRRSSSSASGFSGLPRARAGSDTSVRPSASVMRTRAQRSAGKRRENSASSRSVILAAAASTRGSASFGALTSAGRCRRTPALPRPETAGCTAPPRSSSRIAHADPSAIASRKLSIDSAAMSSAAKPMRTLQRERRLDRRLRPAADRIRLEVLLADPPARAEIVPEGARIVALDRERRRAGETVAREQRRGDADVRAPAGAILHHRRRIAGAQDLTARTEVFGDAERLRGSARRRSAAAARRPPRSRARSTRRSNGSRRRSRAARCPRASRFRSRARDTSGIRGRRRRGRLAGLARRRSAPAAPAGSRRRRVPWSARGRRARRARRSSMRPRTPRRRDPRAGRRTGCARRDRGRELRRRIRVRDRRRAASGCRPRRRRSDRRGSAAPAPRRRPAASSNARSRTNAGTSPTPGGVRAAITLATRAHLPAIAFAPGSASVLRISR